MSKYIYKVCCRLHTQGGEHYALRDDDHSKWGNAELEDKEYVIRKEVHGKKIKVDNETANEVLTRLIKEYGGCDKSEDDIYSGDVIICRNAILNDKKYTFEGTLYEFMNKIQGDAGCKTLIDVKPQMTDNGFFKTGGCACEGEERYDDGDEVYQIHHLRGYKYPVEPIACPVKKFNEGGDVIPKEQKQKHFDFLMLKLKEAYYKKPDIRTLVSFLRGSEVTDFWGLTYDLAKESEVKFVYESGKGSVAYNIWIGDEFAKYIHKLAGSSKRAGQWDYELIEKYLISGQKETGQKISNVETLNEFIQHPDLDASIYIEKIDPKRDKIEYEHGWQYKAKISYPESLGEQGNYEEGFVYKTYPSKEEQETDIRDTLEKERQNIIEGGKKAWGLEEIYSAHDENILKAINKVLDKKSSKESLVPENLSPTPWLIKEKLNLFTDLLTQKDNIKEKAGVAIFYKDKILLTHPTGAGWKGTYSIPKGVMMQGETAIETAGRELREETNIQLPERVVSQFKESQADIILKYREGGQVSQHIKAVTELNIPAIEKEIEANKLLLTETSKILAYKIEEKKKEREELKEKGYNNFKINERVSSMVREEEKLEREIRNYKTNISKNEEIILLYNRVKNENKTKAEIDKLIEFIEKNHHLEYDDRKKIGYHEKEQKLRLNFNSFLWSKNLKTGALINVYFLKDLYKKYGLEFLKQNEASEIEKLENKYIDYRQTRADELFKQWKEENPGKILDTPKQDEYNAMVNKESDAKIDEMAEKIGLFIPGSKSDSEKFLKEHILVVGQPKLQEKLHADIQRRLDAEKKYKADEFETKLDNFTIMLKEGSPKFRYQIKFTPQMVSDFIQQREQTKNGNGEILNDLIFKYKLKGKPDDLKKEFAIAFVQGELPSKLFNKTNLIDADWMAGEMELKIRPIEQKVKVLKNPTLTDKSLSLKDIVYPTGDSYPGLQGVLHDAEKKVLVATDAHVLIKIQDNRIKKTEVRKVDNSGVFITMFDGKEQQPRFPNYEAVIDKDMPIKFKINIQEWLNTTNGVARANKFFGTVYGASGAPRIVIKIIIGEQEFFFNPEYLNKVLAVFVKYELTTATIELNTPRRAMHIKSGEIFGMVMPVMEGELPYYLLHKQ